MTIKVTISDTEITLSDHPTEFEIYHALRLAYLLGERDAAAAIRKSVAAELAVLANSLDGGKRYAIQ